MVCATRFTPALAFALAATLLIAACGGGGSSGSDDGSDNDLVLVKFQLIDRAGNPTGGTGSENAYRNNMLRFEFSAPVDESSVSDRTITIGIPSGGNLFITTPGMFEVDGNVVIFDPTVSPDRERPFGLLANSTYSVMVSGLPDPLTIESTEGKAVLTPFSTTFTTTDLYLPDLDQPRIVSVEPTPQTDIPADRFSTEAQDIWVPSTADVSVTFSEAMNPDTFDPASSFMVTNTDRNREVLGTFRFSEDAKTVTLRPTFGFGRGPYIIRVDLSVDLTDLAGNAIANPQTFEFLTEYDITAVNEGLVEEYFDDNTYEDTTFVPTGAAGKASWNPLSDPGMLASTFGNTSTSIPNPVTTFSSGNSIPMGTGSWNSSWCQLWYRSAEVGNAGTISGAKWFLYSGSAGQAPVLSGFTYMLGHSKGTGVPFANSNPRTSHWAGTPVTCINNVTYSVPSKSVGTPLPFPAFTTAFGYDGTSNIITDISKTSGTINVYWAIQSHPAGARAYAYPASVTTVMGVSTNYLYQCVFDFRTETSMAQSAWYKTESPDPMFLDPILAPTEQPAGTETTVLYQGAEDDGVGTPDPGSFSAWTDDATALEGYEYIRFQASFKANLSTGVGPKISEVLIPYIFF